MLGPILLSLHNLTFYQRLLASAREAIEQDRFAELLNHHRQLWSKESDGDFPEVTTESVG
jgi:queuine tRNA-ribosyltransferase